MTNKKALDSLQAIWNTATQKLPGTILAPAADAAPGAGAATDGDTLTFTLVPVLNSTMNPELLPVPADSALPSFEISLGCFSNDVNPKVIACADPGAGTTCGNSKLWEAIGIRFSKAIKNIVVAFKTRYISITLSGIFKEDKEKIIATVLSVAITLCLPFESMHGKKCNITIACGPDVSIHFLVGISFFKQAKASINFEAH